MTTLEKYVLLEQMRSRLRQEADRVHSIMLELEATAAQEIAPGQRVAIPDSALWPAGRMSVIQAPVKSVGMTQDNLRRWIQEFLVHNGGDTSIAARIVEYCQERKKVETASYGTRPKIQRRVTKPKSG